MSTADDWSLANQRYVAASLARLTARIEPEADSAAAERELERARAALSTPAALDVLAAAFGLTAFERDVVLLAAGFELDAAFAETCARAAGGAPTFALALEVLEGAHWSALMPAAPLRRWRLVEPPAGARLPTAPLRVDERILHFVVGVSYVDDRLDGLIVPLGGDDEPDGTVAVAAALAARVWRSGRGALIQLATDDAQVARSTTAAAASELGAAAFGLDAGDVPASASERDALARLWEREAALLPAVLLVHGARDADVRTVARFVEGVRAPVAVDSSIRPDGCAVVRVDVASQSAAERELRWRRELGDAAPRIDGHLPRLARQFKLNAASIRAAAASALIASSPDALADAAWDACRIESRQALECLAERVTARAGWTDLVLPSSELEKLRQIAVHVRRRVQVYDDWGFAERTSRGLGIVALFAGASGTGKTLAAEIVAEELRLDLFRIDLSRVVSKYIGETEKNLRRVFDAADAGGAVLLFDEADALFGKRSEVKDSHDRYANIEISYLLQRMEAYDGLAILTTNMRSALDSAFLRRIRFVVDFPFPGELERAEIWRRVLPERTPTAGLDLAKLARPAIAGGNIRNVALAGAFIAADEGQAVGMEHLRRALESEYQKLERPLVEHEVGGWT